jgi:hypothetical protein
MQHQTATLHCAAHAQPYAWMGCTLAASRTKPKCKQELLQSHPAGALCSMLLPLFMPATRAAAAHGVGCNFTSSEALLLLLAASQPAVWLGLLAGHNSCSTAAEGGGSRAGQRTGNCAYCAMMACMPCSP